MNNSHSSIDSKAQISHLQQFLQLMWQDYIKMNPQASQIANLLRQHGETVTNDHIALRTFNHPKLGLASLARFFTDYGYRDAGEYTFKEKKLYAKHYEHSDSSLPKIFISELELEKVSPFIQQTINECIQQIPASQMQTESFVYSGRPWKANHATYLKLAAESEYASWVYAYGFRPNHFTVSINHLQKLTQIQKLNEFLKNNQIKLNQSGGEIKGTPEEFLGQSSTMADNTACEFEEGTFQIPGCYFEFAKRYPMQNGKLYQGFIAKSADKIFESTNRQ